jgi:glycosyltransferase involved in cell wall biosynthesis
MIRVLHLAGGGDTGGAKTHILSLLKRLPSENISCTLVSLREGNFPREAREAGIDTRVISDGWRQTIKELVFLSQDFDIIHCHGARANLMGVFLKKHGKPVVTTLHSDYRLDYLGRPLAHVTYGLLGRWALRRIPYHIGVSHEMTRRLLNRRFNPAGLFTLYNGLDPVAGSDVAQKDKDTVTAGLAARLDPVKDVATLIRAAARVKDSCPGLRFAIAGEGPEKAKLEKLCRRTGANVDFLGWLPDTRGFFASLDINILTSLSETFP